MTLKINNVNFIDPVDFVGEPIEHGDFVYFFYRERATEHYDPIIYSRVARVCKVHYHTRVLRFHVKINFLFTFLVKFGFVIFIFVLWTLQCANVKVIFFYSLVNDEPISTLAHSVSWHKFQSLIRLTWQSFSAQSNSNCHELINANLNTTTFRMNGKPIFKRYSCIIKFLSFWGLTGLIF